MRALILSIADKLNSRDKWLIGYFGKWVLLILAFILYTLIIARGAYAKAEKKFEAWQEDYVAGFLRHQEAIDTNMPQLDPYEAQLDSEAQQLARVLYGVKDNSTDDLRTYCWCVFNRVDSPEYADNLKEVIDQPSQWMRYSEDNPVLDDLYRLARTELDAWHSGKTRPCDISFVYMNWSPSEIILRNTWTNTSRTMYWRAR
jgi:hypothetical protein